MRFATVLAGVLALFLALGVLSWMTGPRQSGGAVEETGPSSGEIPRDESGAYRANPFELPSRDEPHPTVEIDSTDHVFGRMVVGETGTKTFLLKNTGDAPLELATGPSSCTCTIGGVASDVIEPGESTEISIEWTPKEAERMFTQRATIWTNDPERPELGMSVTGEVVNSVRTMPQGVWTLGSLPDDEPTKFSGFIASMVEESFEITEVETSRPESIRVTPVPMSEEELREADAVSGYRLDCEIEPNIPVGSFSELITVTTTLEDHAEFRFTVRGDRIGPFHIVGPGWTQTGRVVRMGRFPSSEGKTVRLSLFTRGLEENFAIENIRVEPPVLEVSIERDEDFAANTGRSRYQITVTAPPGIVPGRWTEDSVVSIEMQTNHPEFKTLNFNVDLQAD